MFGVDAVMVAGDRVQAQARTAHVELHHADAAGARGKRPALVQLAQLVIDALVARHVDQEACHSVPPLNEVSGVAVI